MEWATHKTKLSQINSEREMKRIAKTENKTVVGIPEIVRIAVVTIEPQTIIIVFNVEDVEVAIRISNV
jgi:hypothetical protein